MSSRSTILAVAAIATLAFGATALAHGGHGGHGGNVGGHSGHVGGFHHHGGFFVGGYAPYYNDYSNEEADCPPVRVRVRTLHGLRWRWVRSCAY